MPHNFALLFLTNFIYPVTPFNFSKPPLGPRLPCDSVSVSLSLTVSDFPTSDSPLILLSDPRPEARHGGSHNGAGAGDCCLAGRPGQCALRA